MGPCPDGGRGAAGAGVAVARVMVRVLILMLAGLGFALGLARALHDHPHELEATTAGPPAAAADQGCVNQGSDRRIAGTFICWAQRKFSWKSEHEPHFLLIGNPRRTSLGLAWPPYVVFNSPAEKGGWNMFRIGFRYDRGWHGYIFPTVAIKKVARPLRY